MYVFLQNAHLNQLFSKGGRRWIPCHLWTATLMISDYEHCPIQLPWDEIHPAGGPPNWDHHLYWPWENVRMLLTFVPSRMRSVPDRAVVLLYKPMPQQPPLVNPLGLRPQNLQWLMGYCCGSARANSCPIGECYSFLQCFILIIQGSAW